MLNLISLEIIIAIDSAAVPEGSTLNSVSDNIIHQLEADDGISVKRGQLALDTLMMFSILVSSIEEGLAAIQTLSEYEAVSAVDVNSFYADFDQ